MMTLYLFQPATVVADDPFSACEDDPELCIIQNPKDIFKQGDNNISGSTLPHFTGEKNKDPNKPPAILTSAGAKILKIIFTIAGILGVISMVVAGIMMVLAQAGNEELLNTGKKILIYSAIGMIIIAGAYAIILGISNIRLS